MYSRARSALTPTGQDRRPRHRCAQRGTLQRGKRCPTRRIEREHYSTLCCIQRELHFRPSCHLPPGRDQWAHVESLLRRETTEGRRCCLCPNRVQSHCHPCEHIRLAVSFIQCQRGQPHLAPSALREGPCHPSNKGSKSIARLISPAKWMNDHRRV